MKRSELFLIILCFEIYGSITAGTSLNDTSAVLIDSTKMVFPAISRQKNTELNTTWYQMVTEIPGDEYLFFRNSFQSSQIPTYAGLTVLTGSLMKVDISGWKVDRKLYVESNTYKTASNLAVDMGDGRFHFLLSGLFASYGLICSDPVALRAASDIAESVLSTGLLVQALKRVTGRESPAYAANFRWQWHFFPSIEEYQKDESKYYSFPSGHLAAATAVLMVISNDYPEITWLRPAGYPFLGLLGMGLVSKGMHWYSDLPLGYFIGYSMGNIVAPGLKIHDENISNSYPLSVSPGISGKSICLQAAYSF